MYYIYFPFVLVLALMMSYECFTRERPQWWAAVVFFAPVTFPFFVYKSRKNLNMIHLMIFITVFSAVAGGEFFLYTKYMAKHKYASLPPVTRQMMILTDRLRKSTIQLDSALIQLENLSKVEARLDGLEDTIEFIGKLRVIMRNNKQAINELVQYTKDHKDFFEKKELEWVFDLQRFYDNYIVIQHYQSLQKYLDDFEDLLRYSHANFYNITQIKDEEHLKNYDEYYIRYRRSVDAHNRFNVNRIEFQNKYLKKHPQIKAYLPGERQTETFRLWE